MLLKKTTTKTIHRNLHFYPKFNPWDGHQMVNINILTLYLFWNMFLNMLFCKYRICFITNYKNKKQNSTIISLHNIDLKYNYGFYSNLKQN